jgi:hypothetical protein
VEVHVEVWLVRRTGKVRFGIVRVCWRSLNF